MPYKNKADRNANASKWAKAHPEVGRAKQARYRANHPDRVSQRDRDRWAEEKGTWVQFYRSVWININTRAVNGLHPADPNDPKFSLYHRNDIKVLFTLEEFKEWCLGQRAIIEQLYNKMEASGNRGDGPSIDRIDPKGDYALDNIRVITLSENSYLGSMEAHKRPPHNKKLTPEFIILIATLYKEGFKAKALAKHLNISERSVYSAMQSWREAEESASVLQR